MRGGRAAGTATVIGCVALAPGCGARARAPEPVPAAAALAWPRADSLRSTPFAPGVTYHFIHDTTGPWAIHVLDIELERCEPVLRAVKAGPPLAERASTSALARGLAAMNADFFALPAGTTTGAHVQNGRVLIGPGHRPVFAVTASGFAIGRAELDAFVAEGVDTLRIRQLNRHVEFSPALFDAWYGATFTDSAARAIRVQVLEPGRGVITAFAEPGEVTPLDATTVVLSATSAWGRRRAVGDTLVWQVRLLASNGEPVREAVGGFPLLRLDGRDVLDRQPDVRPSFGAQRHPRSAIGWNGEHLFWVLVDGRQTPWSDGMSLRELSDLFAQLGATDALNLDGGGSSALVIDGRVVNRPSDAQGERAVGNAIVLESCRAAA